jgi:NADPH-dependent glutamate synthase beta subunit-like oxidoreductase/CO/xanthine dehydrogenase FAD-binding subunit
VKPFAHHNARTLREAVKFLKQYNGKAKVNAGGTDLLGALRDKSIPEYPEALINIKTIDKLDAIRKSAKQIRIGALAKLADIADSSEVKEEYGLLAQAALSVATPHIRSMATIGGNLAQDVRCWYYRYPRQIGGPIQCLRKGGTLCNALLGDNRYHSLFGSAPLTQNPCSGHCPAGTAIPTYLEYIKAGDLETGARMIMEYNPIPAITGRVCPAFCEADCNRRDLDDPVAIRSIEKRLGDYILQKADRFYGKPDHQTGKSVAIIGSGPAGLSAAFYLRRAAHRVVVFERFPKAGGMLANSIPASRLPRNIVEAQIAVLQGMGIEIRTGVEIGSKLKLPQLIDEFDAVFLAAGAWKERALGVEGDELAVSGLDFLNRVSGGSEDVPGNRVAVVGGGNVAIDVARTLRSLGAEPVILYRRAEAEMPAFEEEVKKAREEGIEFKFLTLPARILRSGDGVVLECVRMKLGAPDESGRPRPEPVAGSEYDLVFDAVMQAIGEEPDLSLLPEEYQESAQESSVLPYHGKNLYLGGDFLTGPSTVAAAVSSGRETASAIGLSFGDRDQAQDLKESAGKFLRTTFDAAGASSNLKEENSLDLKESTMEQEAQRCFNCGCLAVAPSDVAVALVALNAKIITTKRSVSAQDFFRATATSSTILEKDELIKEVRVPKPPAGSFQKYEKFTLRKPIDFAIVSVASLVTEKKGICKDARIVLGAVAPEPIIAKKAEDAVRGRSITGETAEQAAEQAAEGAVPLSMNNYKIDILKSLVKKALLTKKS